MFEGYSWILGLALFFYFVGFLVVVKGLHETNIKLIVPGWITKLVAIGMMIFFAIKVW